MSVLALVTKIEDVHTVVTWASRLATAHETDLAVFCWYQDSSIAGILAENVSDDSRTEEMEEAIDRVIARDTEDDSGIWSHLPSDKIDIIHAMTSHPVEKVLEQVRLLDVQLLVAPVSPPKGIGTRSAYSSDLLLRQSPCNTVVLYGEERSEGKRIMGALSDGHHDRITVSLAARLAQSSNALATIITVEENTGEEAIEVGRRELRQIMRSASIEESEQVQLDVFLADRGIDDIVQTLAAQDLVLVGSNRQKVVRRIKPFLKNTVVGVVKRAPPLRRWGRRRKASKWLLRLNPGDFADMIQNLRAGSRFNIDFMVMLGLAAAIASLGLLQDSVAVVIGSMILAPLMTPLVGSGLALVQANPRLAKLCFKTIFLGFLLTLAISFVMGKITPGETLTPQVLARGEPNLLDLLIALFSGAAAAYALARPNLIGAVAGVAIAVALVPPLCSVGIALSYDKPWVALGAAALFATNLVAIILAAALVFHLLGVTASATTPFQRRWVYEVIGALGITAILLAVPLHKALEKRVELGVPQPSTFPVTRSVLTAVLKYISQDPEVELLAIGRPIEEDKKIDVYICLVSPRPLPTRVADDLTEIVRREMENQEIRVKVYCVQEAWEP